MLKRTTILTVLLGAAFLLAGVARATTLEDVDASCPSCARDFTAVVVRSTNTYGGIDADGCTHANGTSPLAFAVRVCPHCLCARIGGMARRAPDGKAARGYLKRVVQAREFGTDATQAQIPVWDKYTLACDLLVAEGARGEHLAEATIRGAWALRAEVRETLIHAEHGWSYDIPEAWRRLSDESWGRYLVSDRKTPGTRSRAGRQVTAALGVHRDTEPGTGAANEALRRLWAAVVLRSHGELFAVEGELESLAPGGSRWRGAEVPEEDHGLRDWIQSTAGRLHAELGREREFLKRCSEAVAGKKSSRKVLRMTWREAWRTSECERRLGNDDMAVVLATRALTDDEFPTSLLVLLRDVAEWAGDPTPKWRTVIRHAWDVRIARLIGRLSDIDEAEVAASDLAAIADRSVLGELAVLAAGEDLTAAAFAIHSLAGYERPGARVVSLVEKRVRDSEEDIDVRAEGMAALAAWALPSSAPVFRKALGPDDDYLHDAAVTGLGRTGGPEDVPAILAVAEENAEAVLTSASLLAGRGFADVDEIGPWFEKNRERKGWVEDALRRAGAKFESLDDTKAVPELLPLLMHARLPVRWSAFRALRRITGERFGLSNVLYQGRFQTPRGPEAAFEIEHVLGDGWAVSLRGVPAFDLDDMGDAVQPLRDDDGKTVWRYAQARWEAWWAAR